MKSSGIVRKVDNLGRIVIPIEIRRALSIDIKDPLEISLDGDLIVLRRQTTKFNGVSYIVQRGAEAVFTAKGRAQIKENIAYYRKNACMITQALDELGLWYTGGKNSPYIWLRCPNGMDSWEFFDRLLTGMGIVGTPGAGFGKNGKNFFRLTAFSTHEKTAEAMKRLRAGDLI